MTKIVAIVGQSNTYKSSILRDLSHYYETAYIPKHFTTRKRRKDDSDFYVFKTHSPSSQNIILSSGESGHEYGILGRVSDFNSHDLIFVVVSFKDITTLRNISSINKFELLVIALYSSNLKKRLLQSYKYDDEEMKYRLKTNTVDLKNYFLSKYSDDLLFDIEQNYYSEILNVIKMRIGEN